MQLYLRELKVDILALCNIYFFEFPAIHFKIDFDILIVYNILHLKSSNFKILILQVDESGVGVFFDKLLYTVWEEWKIIVFNPSKGIDGSSLIRFNDSKFYLCSVGMLSLFLHLPDEIH